MMNKLKYAVVALALLAGCDTTESNTGISDNPKKIVGTYQTWAWRHGHKVPDKDYVIFKAVFTSKYYYWHSFTTNRVHVRPYQYDDDSKRIRFAAGDYPNPIWLGWEEVRWYNEITFCIINEDCFHKVSEDIE